MIKITMQQFNNVLKNNNIKVDNYLIKRAMKKEYEITLNKLKDKLPIVDYKESDIYE